MIVVKPMSGQTKIKVTGLYQWDQLQTLQFADVYPIGTEVHFGIKDETVALVYLLENGSVRIPSVLLRRALPVMAWVHVGETTVLEIEMPVIARAMPSDYMGIEDDVQHSVEYRTIKLEQWQVEAIKQMSDRYTKAETDQKLNLKADAKRVYTKVEANTLLNEKADVNTVDDGLSDRYTKAETDVLLDEKATVTEMSEGLSALTTELATARNGEVSLDERLDGIDLEVGDRYTKAEADAKLAGKANKQQEDWITPTLSAPYTNDVKYLKDSLGFVHFVGRASTGDGAQSLLFTLPVGYRPSYQLDFRVHSNNVSGGGQIRIKTNGEVHNFLYHTFINLDGITFRAEL